MPFQKGDHVTVTFTGEVTGVANFGGAGAALVVKPDDGDGGLATLPCRSTSGVKIERDLPPEPAIGGIVRNRHGRALLRCTDGWWRYPADVEDARDAGTFRCTWRTIVLIQGLDEVIYDRVKELNQR